MTDAIFDMVAAMMHQPKRFYSNLSCIHQHQTETTLVRMETRFARYGGSKRDIDDIIFEGMSKSYYKIEQKFQNIEVSLIEYESLAVIRKMWDIKIGSVLSPKPLKGVKPYVRYQDKFEIKEFTSLDRRADRISLYINKVLDALVKMDSDMGWNNRCLDDIRKFTLYQVKALDHPDDGMVDDPFCVDL